MNADLKRQTAPIQQLQLQGLLLTARAVRVPVAGALCRAVAVHKALAVAVSVPFVVSIRVHPRPTLLPLQSLR
jgi:hypothetical protein